jgi:hypothetical protein
MTDTLYDLIDSADLMDIDGMSIRYFGLDIDGLDEDEGDDAMCLHVDFTDEDFNGWEWFFTIKELKEAKFNPKTKEWAVNYAGTANDVCNDSEILISLYTVTNIIPRGY